MKRVFLVLAAIGAVAVVLGFLWIVFLFRDSARSTKVYEVAAENLLLQVWKEERVWDEGEPELILRVQDESGRELGQTLVGFSEYGDDAAKVGGFEVAQYSGFSILIANGVKERPLAIWDHRGKAFSPRLMDTRTGVGWRQAALDQLRDRCRLRGLSGFSFLFW